MSGERKSLTSSYVICAYVRLSMEDSDVGGQKAESGSISSQRELICRYIDSHPEFSGCMVIERCDDGYCGTHFDTRPQFTDMIGLAKKEKINCIIVKDCSRFGRDYVEMGDYLERFFPLLGIRFISINDGYDSAQTEGGLDSAFKNLVYDLYSRELSVKVKQAKRRMAEQGKYSAGQTLYGYRKKREDRHSLEKDPEAAAVVRDIFDMRLSGMGISEIARNLNDRGIPCPTVLCWQKRRPAIRKDTGRKLLRLNPVTVHCGMEYAFSVPGECDGVRMKWKEADAVVLGDLKAEVALEQEGSMDKKEIRSFLDITEMTEEIWERFIKHVVVYPGNRMEIRWNFEEEI